MRNVLPSRYVSVSLRIHVFCTLGFTSTRGNATSYTEVFSVFEVISFSFHWWKYACQIMSVCLCVLLITFETTYSGSWNLVGNDATEGDLNMIIFSPIASPFLKWLRFKLLRWMQYLHHSALFNSGLGMVNIVGKLGNLVLFRTFVLYLMTLCWL